MRHHIYTDTSSSHRIKIIIVKVTIPLSVFVTLDTLLFQNVQPAELPLTRTMQSHDIVAPAIGL